MKKIFALILCSVQCATTYPRHHQKIVYAPHEQTKQAITIAISSASNDELKKCFGSSGSKSTIPLKISITNHGNRTLNFLPQDISIPLKSHRQVRSLFSRTLFDYLWTAVPLTLGISAAVSVALASAAFTPWFILSAPIAVLSFAGFVSIPTGIVVTTDYAINRRHYNNQEITKSLSCHNVITSDTQEVTLPAGSTCDAYVFVSTKKFNPEFEITLHDTVTHEALRFPINLVGTQE